MSRAKGYEDSNCPILLTVIGQGWFPILKAPGAMKHIRRNTPNLFHCVLDAFLSYPRTFHLHHLPHIEHLFLSLAQIPNRLWYSPLICTP